MPGRSLVKSVKAFHTVTDTLEVSASDLLAYFERRVGPQDAPDLLSELMVTAFRRASSLPVRPLEARMWLFGIARNLVLNLERSDRRKTRLVSRLRALPAGSAAPAPDDGADVRDAVGRLDNGDAELIRLVHWEGFSLQEAASILELSPSTARGRYQRAKAKLRAELGL